MNTNEQNVQYDSIIIENVCAIIKIYASLIIIILLSMNYFTISGVSSRGAEGATAPSSKLNHQFAPFLGHNFFHLAPLWKYDKTPLRAFSDEFGVFLQTTLLHEIITG